MATFLPGTSVAIISLFLVSGAWYRVRSGVVIRAR